MDHFELAEKLSKTAGVKYEVAKFALEKNNWDILEALVYLEGFKSPDKSSKKEMDSESEKNVDTKLNSEKIKKGFQEIALEGMNLLINFFIKILKGRVEIYEKRKIVLEIPALVVIILVIAFYRVIAPIIFFSFIFGLRFRLIDSNAAFTDQKEDIEK